MAYCGKKLNLIRANGDAEKSAYDTKELCSPKYIFEKLTPISDGDIGIYKDAIDYAFSEDDICNIAISGAYGAGKRM